MHVRMKPHIYTRKPSLEPTDIMYLHLRHVKNKKIYVHDKLKETNTTFSPCSLFFGSGMTSATSLFLHVCSFDSKDNQKKYSISQ